MKIEILGDGCAKCETLRKRVTQAVNELGLKGEVESVMDPDRLAAHHAMSLPGLVINGTMHPAPGGLSVEQIKEILIKEG